MPYYAMIHTEPGKEHLHLINSFDKFYPNLQRVENPDPPLRTLDVCDRVNMTERQMGYQSNRIATLLLLIALLLIFVHSELDDSCAHSEQHELHDFCSLIRSAIKMDGRVLLMALLSAAVVVSPFRLLDENSIELAPCYFLRFCQYLLIPSSAPGTLRN